MSRAIVINKSAAQRMFNSVKKKINAIRSSGFPKEIADMSLPGLGFMGISPLLADHSLLDFPMSADSPLPLSFTEFKPGDMVFYVPENLRLKTNDTFKPGIVPVQPSKVTAEPNSDRTSVTKHREDVMVNTQRLQRMEHLVEMEEEITTGDDKLADSVIATMRENNLEVLEPEAISPGVTRITLEDILGQRQIRIPEYVMARR